MVTAVTATQWGDVSSWVSAVATVFALVFALLAAVATRRAYRIEIRRDEENEKERQRQHEFVRRAQAALVSAWWGSRTSQDADGPHWGAFVRNASETPVYQANLAVVNLHDADVNERFTLPVIPPAQEPSFHPIRMVGREMTATTAADYRVEMTFTDATGNRWMRDQHGRLTDVLPELVIFADSQRTEVLDMYADQFLAGHQVTVSFRTHPIETLRTEFLAAAASGRAPDVLVGPHDWIGNLVRLGMIEPVGLSAQRQAAFVDRALEAMTYGGRLYGVPYAADSIALLRNLDLAPRPPATVEEMIEEGRALCRSGRADEPLALQVGNGDGFYVYPLFTSAGGRMLHRLPDGRWDPDALTDDGSAAAFERLRALGERGEGILRREIDRDRAIELFVKGRTPYLVCAPWGIGEARRAGIDVGISATPGFADGGPARSLVAVHGFYLASAGRNKGVAQDLLGEYMTRTDVALQLYAAQPRTPALRTALDHVRGGDPLSTVFHEQCVRGDLIPSHPGVERMWQIFHRAQTAVVAGEEVAPVLRRLRAEVLAENAA